MSSHSTYAKALQTVANMAAADPQPADEVLNVIPGKEHLMVANHGGGYGFEITRANLITRICILGTSSNYYKSGEELTGDCIMKVKNFIDEGHHMEVINVLRDIYKNSRAPTQTPTFSLLAMICRHPNLEARKEGFKIISENLRTMSHLYSFKKLHMVAGTSKGWGRLPKSAFSKFFTNLNAQGLAYQAFKYQNREGWSARDLLRCAHLNPSKLTPSMQIVLRAIVSGFIDSTKKDREGKVVQVEGAFTLALKLQDKVHVDLAEPVNSSDTPTNIEFKNTYNYLHAIYQLKMMSAENIDYIPQIIELINQYNFTREFLPTWSLRDTNVWKALLFRADGSVRMPFTALIRNLRVITQRKIFDDPEAVESIKNHIINDKVIKESHIHPIKLLIAYFTYRNGTNKYTGIPAYVLELAKAEGHAIEQPVSDYHPTIVQALETAFYKSFGNVSPTGRKIWHLIDASGSMSVSIPTLPQMTAAQASVVMSMVYSRSEAPNTQEFYLFSRTGPMKKVYVAPEMNLNETTKIMKYAEWGCTNLANPVVRALDMAKSGTPPDKLPEIFMYYTDNDVNTGRHVNMVLKEYREFTKLDAKVIVLATTASSSTVADPTMPESMLDVVGFDTSAPDVIHNFITNQF